MAEELESDLRQATKAAAAAAAVGAAVGVARSLAARAEDAARRGRDGPEDDAEISEAESEEESLGDDDGPQLEQEPDSEREPERELEPDPEPEPRKGVDARSVRRVADRAREYLQELSGADVESVSGLDQTAVGWAVTLEAVEVRRIPESTDVLATYEVELDEDGDLVRYERLRRYARAQSDRGDV